MEWEILTILSHKVTKLLFFTFCVKSSVYLCDVTIYDGCNYNKPTSYDFKLWSSLRKNSIIFYKKISIYIKWRMLNVFLLLPRKLSLVSHFFFVKQYFHCYIISIILEESSRSWTKLADLLFKIKYHYWQSTNILIKCSIKHYKLLT